VALVSHAVVLANRLALESGNRLSTMTVAAIRRTIEELVTLGVHEIAVVDGRQSEELRDRLKLHTVAANVRVLANTSWKNLSGSSVLIARKWIEDSQSCLVVRGDRPLRTEDLQFLALSGIDPQRGTDALITVAPRGHSMPRAAAPPTGTAGRVPPRSTYSDPSCAAEVRVLLAGELEDVHGVADLGEDLVDASEVFTGHAIVNGAILEALEGLPSPTLEHGLLALVARGRVSAIRVEWPWSKPHVIAVDDKVTALLEAKRHARYTLLNPGPVNTTANVKSALVHHDVCHRDSTFSELMVSLTGKLRRIFRGTPNHTVVAITGSGTAAMETALVSSVPADRKILVIDNGAFGERLVEVTRVHEMDIVHLRYEWGQLVRPEDVAHALETYPEIAVVAMIHHETSVGLLNPIKAVGALCRAHDVLFVVDAVSSLGAEDVDVVRDNIDICYASANKCLHAVSGASFMCVAPRVWSRIENLKPRAYYLDLRRYRRYMDELAQTPFTPAVSVYFALDAACSEFLADGHVARFAMYRARNERLRAGLAALDMPSFTTTGAESHSIVTCRLPDGILYEPLYDAIKERGIIVYGCKGVLADRFMQIANMGDLPDDAIDEFLVALTHSIAELRRRGGAPGLDQSAVLEPADLRESARHAS
jgi:2-aminoethylphosphonate-pyruvate transaminase